MLALLRAWPLCWANWQAVLQALFRENREGSLSKPCAFWVTVLGKLAHTALGLICSAKALLVLQSLIKAVVQRHP